MIKRSVLTLATASILCAQSTVQGPTVGWLYDSAGASLRAVLGIPGSSTLGPHLDLGFDLSQAHIAPNGNLAIASAASDGRMLRLDLRRGGQPAAISGVPASADAIVFSPTGSAALLIYRNAEKIVVLPNLAGPASAPREIGFSSGMPDTFAVSDDAMVLLAAGPDRLQALDSDGNRWNLNFTGPARSLAFVAQSHDALVTDRRGLWLVRDAAANAESRLLWEGNATQALMSEARKAALILTERQTLIAVNLESGATRNIECFCEPQLLARMSESVIRVTRLSDGPLWLVDWTGQEPRAVFVPAEVKSEQ